MIAPVVTPLISLTTTPSGPVNLPNDLRQSLLGLGRQTPQKWGIFMIHVIFTGGVTRGEAGPGLGTIAGLQDEISIEDKSSAERLSNAGRDLQ